MRASQQLKYAIYGVFDLAYNGGDRPLRIQEISVRQGIPPRYLEQIFQRIRRAGLVSSKRGPGGGYVLACRPDEITLADVAVAVEGALLSPTSNGDVDGSQSPSFVWDELRSAMERTLGATTLAQLCRDAARNGVERAENEPAMYEI